MFSMKFSNLLEFYYLNEFITLKCVKEGRWLENILSNVWQEQIKFKEAKKLHESNHNL